MDNLSSLEREFISLKRDLQKCRKIVQDFMDDVYEQDCDVDAELLTNFQISWYEKFENFVNNSSHF